MVNLTKSTKPVSGDSVIRNWVLIDAEGKVLGRIAPEITRLLQGKNKTDYVSYLDVGENVVVINASKVVVTGKKEQQKVYTSYSGYPGGLKKISYAEMMAADSRQVIIHAVSGMLPKNKFRDQRLRRMFVYKDNKHPYSDKFKIS